MMLLLSVHMIKIYATIAEPLTASASIVEPLCLIFEKSFNTGTNPSAWKKVNIVTIHKKGSKQNKINYRTISLLSAFGKILETEMLDDVYQYLSLDGFLAQRLNFIWETLPLIDCFFVRSAILCRAIG